MQGKRSWDPTPQPSCSFWEAARSLGTGSKTNPQGSRDGEVRKKKSRVFSAVEAICASIKLALHCSGSAGWTCREPWSYIKAGI